MVTALLLNPSAAADTPTLGSGEGLVLHPVGTEQPGLRLDDLLADLDARRNALRSDPSSSLRMTMRMIEVPLSLGAHDLAERMIETLLPDEPLYQETRRAQVQIARGDVMAALPALEATAALGYFWSQVDLVDALSRTADTATDTFQAQYDEAVRRMRSGGVDCVFDLPRVCVLIEARLRWHERRGDPLGAVRAADALAFARR
jgi:hypothetical protein